MKKRKKHSKLFKELMLWERSQRLVIDIFKNVKSTADGEFFGLASQIKRSSVYAAAHLANAFKKKGPDKIKTLKIAQRALSETTYYLTCSKNPDFAIDELAIEAKQVGKVLKKYRAMIKNDFKS